MSPIEVSASLRLKIGAYLSDLATARQATRKHFSDTERDAKQSGDRTAAEMGRVGSEAGRKFGDGFARDATSKVRAASSRLGSEGSKAGNSFGNGFNQAARSRIGAGLSGVGSALGSISSSMGNISGRPLIALAGGAAAAAGALNGIPPVLGAIGGMLASLPALAAGAMGSIGTLSLGSAGIGSAIGEIFSPKGGGGGGGGGGGAQIDQVAGATRRLEQAERQLSRAQADAKEAQRDLNDAREDATRELRDMSIQLSGLRLDEEAATLNVADAERELAKAREAATFNPSADTASDLQRADLAYRQAQQSLTETSTRLGDLEVDQKKAAKAGVEGSDTYRDALKRQEQSLDAVKDAQYGVLDAQEALKAAQAGSGGGGGGGGGAPTAYSKLSKEAKAFVDQIRAMKDDLIDLQHLAQDKIFAGLDDELRQTAAVALPFARKQVSMFGETWNQTFKQLFKLGRDPQFLAGLEDAFQATDGLFDKLNARIPTTGRMLSQLFTGSVPFIDRFGDSLLSYIDDFNAFIDKSAKNGDLERFFADAAEQADALLDIGKQVFVLVGRIGGMRQGSTLLRDMADALERFNSEAHSMESVEGIVRTGEAAIKGLVDVLLILGEAMGDSLADPATRDAVVLFFDVLKAGAQVVAELASVFRLLPDGMQSVILAGAALAIVFGKLQNSKIGGVLGSLGDASDRAAERLGKMGPAGEKAGKGLQTAANAAGKAAGAFVALQVIGVVLDQFDDSAPKVDALNRSLEEFRTKGVVGGEMTRLWGDGLDRFGQQAKAASDGWFPNLMRGVEGLLPPAKSLNEAFFGGSFTGDKERFVTLDTQLKQMAVSTGDLNGVTKIYQQLQSQSGKDLGEFNKLLPETYAWLQQQQSAAHGLTAEQNLLNGTMEDAIKVTGSYTNAWKALNGVQLDSDEANLAALDAIERMGEAFRTNGTKIDGNSRAALSNRIAVGQAAQAGAELAQQKYNETGSVEKATGAYNQHINALKAEMKAAGLTEGQINSLIGKYTKMPPLNLKHNLDSANAKLAQLFQYAKALDGKVIRISTEVSGAVGPTGFAAAKRWGGLSEDGVQYAARGLVNLRRAAVYPARSNPTYGFAEKQTGGEAFVPRNGDPKRSVSILDRAASWYGMDVVPKAGAERYGRSAQASSGDYGRPMPMPSGSTGGGIDYARMGAAVAANLAPVVAGMASGGGDVVIQLDGVEIARAARSGERDLDRRG